MQEKDKVQSIRGLREAISRSEPFPELIEQAIKSRLPEGKEYKFAAIGEIKVTNISNPNPDDTFITYFTDSDFCILPVRCCAAGLTNQFNAGDPFIYKLNDIVYTEAPFSDSIRVTMRNGEELNLEFDEKIYEKVENYKTSGALHQVYMKLFSSALD